MKRFTAGAGSGHDHFFATFDKFGAATAGHAGEMLAEVAEQAVSEHEHYLEPLVTFQFAAVSALARSAGFDPDLAVLRRRLFAGGAMDRIVAAVSSACSGVSSAAVIT